VRTLRRGHTQRQRRLHQRERHSIHLQDISESLERESRRAAQCGQVRRRSYSWRHEAVCRVRQRTRQQLSAPGLRPNYSGKYYAAFVIGPDGHNIEVVCHEPEAW